MVCAQRSARRRFDPGSGVGRWELTRAVDLKTPSSAFQGNVVATARAYFPLIPDIHTEHCFGPTEKQGAVWSQRASHPLQDGHACGHIEVEQHVSQQKVSSPMPFRAAALIRLVHLATSIVPSN